MGIKKKFLSGALAVLLAGAPVTLVSAEEQIVQSETQTQLIDLFRVGYEMNPNYDKKKAEYSIYRSEDGSVTKKYWSYLPMIDGLFRTDETEPVDNGNYREGQICDIKESHYHCYYNTSLGMMRPFPGEENEIIINGQKWVKMKMIVQINEQALQILNDYNLYRLSDNIDFIQAWLTKANKEGYLGMAFFYPRTITDTALEVDIKPIKEKEFIYTSDMDGYLFSPNDIAFKEELKAEDMTLVLNKPDAKAQNIVLTK